jgi:anthranilate phosphoribosyltransferase
VFPLLAEKNYLLTSYTHPPYRATMTDLLKDKSALDRVIIVRGTEGGIQLGLDRKSPWVNVQSGTGDAEFIHPSLFGLSEVKDQVIETALDASAILDAGVEALSGKRGLVFDLLVYQVCAISYLFQLMPDPSDILKKVTASIDDGLALRHWQKGQLR